MTKIIYIKKYLRYFLAYYAIGIVVMFLNQSYHGMGAIEILSNPWFWALNFVWPLMIGFDILLLASRE